MVCLASDKGDASLLVTESLVTPQIGKLADSLGRVLCVEVGVFLSSPRDLHISMRKNTQFLSEFR
jgi:hypothetical protein